MVHFQMGFNNQEQVMIAQVPNKKCQILKYHEKSKIKFRSQLRFQNFFDPIHDYAMSPVNFSHMNQTTT